MAKMRMIGLALALGATLGACRDGGGDSSCSDEDDQWFCCWVADDGDTTCAVTSFCNPNEPTDCYPERTTYLWAVVGTLDDALEEWGAEPCHEEDPSLWDECE